MVHTKGYVFLCQIPNGWGATTVLKNWACVVGGRKDSQRLRPQDPVEITCVTDEECDVNATARSGLTALVAPV